MDAVTQELLAFWAYLKPGLLAVLYAGAGSLILSMAGGLVAAVLEGLETLRDRINENETMKLAQTDDWLFDRIGEVVDATYHEYVKEIKAANADGKLTPDEARGARVKAMEYFMGSLSKVELGDLVKLLGEDFRTIVLGRIELRVAAAKAEAREARTEAPEGIVDLPEEWQEPEEEYETPESD